MKLVPILLLALASAAPADDEDVLSCDATDGFQAPARGANLTASEGCLVLAYDRATLSPVANGAPITGLKELRLRLRSKEPGNFAVVVKDRDGATWNQPFRLEAGTWTDVVLTPAKFALNADSAVKKEKLDPGRLGSGWLVVDGAAIGGGGTGRNELRIDEVRVVREAPEETSGTWTIEAAEVVTKSRRHKGTIVVKRGGSLRVTAPRFVLEGDLTILAGAAEFDGGVVEIPQRFNHERTLTVHGSLSFLGAAVVTRVPAAIKMRSGSVTFRNTEVAGGFTCDVPEQGTVTLDAATNPGEFVIAPGGKVRVADSTGVILWLSLGANLKGPLQLPGDAVAGKWAAGSGLDVEVERTTGLKACLLSLPGSDGSIHDCNPPAAGLLFGGKTDLSLDGLENRRAMDAWTLPAPDRKLSFRNATVGAWNIYAEDEAAVRLKKATVGEVMTFKEARAELEDSVVDGTGGYVGAHDDSVIRLTRCKVTCLVVARLCSTIELVDCEVKGDVRAIEAARVRLVRTTVSGKVEAEGGGKIERP